MLIIGIDPSGEFGKTGYGTTGFAIVKYINNKIDWSTLYGGVIEAENYKTYFEYYLGVKSIIQQRAIYVDTLDYSKVHTTMLEHAIKEVFIVIEDFKQRQSILKNRDNATSKLIGLLEYEFKYYRKCKVYFQQSSQIKSFCTTDNMIEFTKGHYKRYKNKHIRDAIKHLVYFEKFNKEFNKIIEGQK